MADLAPHPRPGRPRERRRRRGSGLDVRGWQDRFGLPFPASDIGFGHDSTQVGEVHADAQLLADYHGDVHLATLEYLDELTADELDRVVDRRWDPPVTVSVRLVSVIGDCLQHLGQAAYVRGLFEAR